MHTPNLAEGNIARIRELFPSCVTEARGEDGGVKLVVDFDQLKQELSDSIIEGPQERYHLDWPGKREALLTANTPIAKTLRPCREESVDFDTTKNLFIEGDNLDALKLLQEAYLGKVKLIYIDPPYFTTHRVPPLCSAYPEYRAHRHQRQDSGPPADSLSMARLRCRRSGQVALDFGLHYSEKGDNLRVRKMTTGVWAYS